MIEPPTPGRDGGRSPLVDLLPTFTPFHAWFNAVPVAAPTIASGHSAWFGLERLKAGDNIDQELLVSGIEAELLPADVLGAYGGSSPLAWGDAGGLAAAIVVGIDLPIQRGAWTSAPALVPGIETTQTTGQTIGGDTRVLWYATFPTGKLTDTTPNKWHLVKSWGPVVSRIPQGRNLDIALIVRRSMIHNQTGNVFGHASIIVTAGLANTQAAFSR